MALTSSVVWTTPVRLGAVLFVLAVPLAACGGTEKAANTNTTAATTQKPQPTSVQQVCDAQSWPRPVPAVVGLILDDVDVGSLGCWDNIREIAPDGHDAYNNSTRDDVRTTYRITDISPSPGTPIGRNDWVTLHVVPVNLLTAPAAFHPCDWVTAAEAARFLGDPSATTNPTDDESGATSPFCTYSTGSHFVTSQLHLPASFPVDARTAFNMWGADGEGSDVEGLPGPARCTSVQRDTGPLRTLLVLLSGDRTYAADALNVSCDTLRQFAEAAIPRIGP
jgi:hypothetical protein